MYWRLLSFLKVERFLVIVSSDQQLTDTILNQDQPMQQLYLR